MSAAAEETRQRAGGAATADKKEICRLTRAMTKNANLGSRLEKEQTKLDEESVRGMKGLYSKRLELQSSLTDYIHMTNSQDHLPVGLRGKELHEYRWGVKKRVKETNVPSLLEDAKSMSLPELYSLKELERREMVKCQEFKREAMQSLRSLTKLENQQLTPRGKVRDRARQSSSIKEKGISETGLTETDGYISRKYSQTNISSNSLGKSIEFPSHARKKSVMNIERLQTGTSYSDSEVVSRKKSELTGKSFRESSLNQKEISLAKKAVSLWRTPSIATPPNKQLQLWSSLSIDDILNMRVKDKKKVEKQDNMKTFDSLLSNATARLKDYKHAQHERFMRQTVAPLAEEKESSKRNAGDRKRILMSLIDNSNA